MSIDANGLLATSTGKQSYADIIADELRTMKGEIILAPSQGIDYMGTVFVSSSKLNIWKHYVRKAVEELDFVTGVQSFDASFDSTTRVLTYSMVVSTDLGTVTVSS